LCIFLEFAAQAFDAEQQFLRVPQQAFAGRRRHYAARMAHQQRRVHGVLKFLDALADRRDGQLPLLGRSTDAARLADQDEKVERSEVELAHEAAQGSE